MFGVAIEALSMIMKLLVEVGDVPCFMTFMIVDIDNYDLLVGLGFLIKIGVIVIIRNWPKCKHYICNYM
jgi:hypothetical protein